MPIIPLYIHLFTSTKIFKEKYMIKLGCSLRLVFERQLKDRKVEKVIVMLYYGNFHSSELNRTI